MPPGYKFIDMDSSGNQSHPESIVANDAGLTFDVTPLNKADVSNLHLGDVVADRYKIVSVIGHGGMGSVFKVEQIYLRQVFALKTLTGQAFPDVAIRRFQKEAQAASRLAHPNLVRAHDFGLINQSQPFYIMDFIEGKNLSEYSKQKGILSVEEILQIFIPICFGLGYAHREGIIHRDIKPGNIMLDKPDNPDQNYVPKVVDFGIAKLAEVEGMESVALTRTGEIFGTPLYMSPEQCSGLKLDHRTDIYSLGCVMYEALTGAPPFHADTALALMLKHQSEIPQSLKEA
ncbi:MAG: serine/threonine protein kinase, partial [Leptolyngbya sp.]|nr:serine/threonine protein kinase [Candidatus Melainabacteria bacterium]